MAPELAAVEELVRSGAVVAAVEDGDRPAHLTRFQRGIQRPEALALLAVGLDPVGHRVDLVARLDGCSHAGVDVRPHLRRDPAEDRRAERGALVDRHVLERQFEHRGDDLRPQPAARAATRDAPEFRYAAELSDEVERVAEAERDALEHRACQGAAVVAEAEPDERATGVRVGVGGALAGEVGEEDQIFGARRPLGRFCSGASS